MMYLIVASVISVHESHPSIASLLKCDVSYICTPVDKISTVMHVAFFVAWFLCNSRIFVLFYIRPWLQHDKTLR